MRDIERVIKAADRAAGTRHLIEGFKRAAFQNTGEGGWSVTFFRLQINDATERVRSVKTALWPAQHFDARQVPGQHLAKVERVIRTRIVHVDPVDDNLGLVRVGAAYENRSLSTRATGLNNV